MQGVEPGQFLSHPPGWVARADLWWLRFALGRPHAAAHGSTSIREVLVLRITTANGVVGWGECDALEAPGYSAEYTAGAWRSLVEQALPDLLGGGAGAVHGRPMATAAVVDACLDARLREEGRSLRDELGGAAGAVPSRGVCAEMSDLDRLVEQVAGCLDAGHRSIKLKVRPGWDSIPVGAVRARWPGLDIAVDANGSYPDLDSATRAAESMAEFGVTYFEQPLEPADVSGSAALVQRSPIPVALDESVDSPEALRQAVESGAGELLNVKPARLGGVVAASEAAALAVASGWRCFCGGMLEAGVGRATALAVASLSACSLPTDLGPSSRYLVPDIAPARELDDEGRLTVPSGPGIGIDPDLDRITQLAIATWGVAT